MTEVGVRDPETGTGDSIRIKIFIFPLKIQTTCILLCTFHFHLQRWGHRLFRGWGGGGGGLGGTLEPPGFTKGTPGGET